MTIADLQHDGWQSLLPNVAWLGDLYEEYKKHDTTRRTVSVHLGGDEDRPGGVHASEISGCTRRLVYSILNTEKKNNATQADTNMRRRMQLGTLVHAITQDDFDRMCWMSDGAVEFKHELTIRPDLQELARQYDINSSCDGAFTYFANHQPYLRVGLEIKTKSDPEYQKLKKPDDEHIEQAHVYMKALDLPLMWFFYYNKSNSNWTPPKPPYLVAFDHRVWDRLENKIQHSHKLASSKTLPERQEGMPCRWCPFSWTCMPTTLQRRPTHSAKGPPKPGEFRR